MRTLKQTAAVLVIGFFLFSVPTAAKADWVGDWKNTLGELWSATKTKTMEVLDSSKLAKYIPKKKVEIGIAYGTEKRKWLEWAVAEFAKTEEGKNIKVKLIPMGSIEGAKAVLAKDKRIHVWSPASSLVEELLTDPWSREYNKSPILSDAPLALTPMVIVMWKERYEAFHAKYPETNFTTIGEALLVDTGWEGIAGKPEWGFFNFGHTKPTHSNSGLLSLVLMAYDFHSLRRGVKAKHIMDKEFLTWLETVEENMNVDETSTGRLMTRMLRFGPSELDGVIVYENLALANLGTAAGRWGEIQVVYPSQNVWNDNPYYILDVPWTDEDHQNAAKVFQFFLLSEKSQRVVRDKYLFRPANIDLPIVEEGSAFSKLQNIVHVNVPAIQRPKAEVLNQLIDVWKRVQ
jgi:ABC-type Fe3+ transport system substrate-binding protein